MSLESTARSGHNEAGKSLRIATSCFVVFTLLFCAPSNAKDIGSVDTKFNLLSPDDTIKVASFNDPAVGGVTCYVSSAEKGGFKMQLQLASTTNQMLPSLA